jgi:uncharacterized membrane protein YuzA (DUF378 family)
LLLKAVASVSSAEVGAMLNTIIYIIIGLFVAYSLVIVMGLWENVENARKEEERKNMDR